MAFTPQSDPLPAADEEHLRRSVRRKIAWRFVPLLGAAYCMALMERNNLGIASLEMNQSLGLAPAVYGLVAGLFFLGYFVFEVPSNLAMARFGARIWLARIALTWGLVATLTAFVQGPVSLSILRVLLGIAEAGLFPGVVFFFTLWFPPRDRARMLALFTLGGTASAVIGPPLAGTILTLWPDGLLGLESWRALFLVEGLPSLVIAVLIWRYLVDGPDKAPWLSNREKQWLVAQLDDPAGNRRHNPLRTLLDVRILLLSVVYFAKNCGGYVLIFFMPQIIRSLSTQDGGPGYSTLTISLLAAIPATATVVAGLLWAVNSDRMQERRWHAALPLFVGAAGIVWSASTANPILLLVALTIANVGISSMTEAFFQLPSVFLAGPAVAVGIAAVNATGNLGGFAGPYVFGLLQQSTGSFYVGTVVLAVLLVAGGLIIFLPMFRPTPAAPAAARPATALTDSPSRDIETKG